MVGLTHGNQYEMYLFKNKVELENNNYQRRNSRMKRLFVLIAVLMFGAMASAEDFAIDVTHSSIGFRVSHMVISKVPGEFRAYEGTIKGFDGADISTGSVELSIDAASIDTRNENRNGHLQSPDFFDAAKFPKITFKSKKVVKGAGNAFQLVGDLTMRDSTKEVTLDCTFNGKFSDAKGNTTVGFSGTGKIDRQQFGITYGKVLDTGGLAIGNEVEISIEIEAVHKKG
jgi:polyisoprenoid-binding protein YceI